MVFTEQQCQNLDFAMKREWVLPNGIGGFAMGTVSGINSRRYHGYLIGAIKPPTDRQLLLSTVEATAFSGTQRLSLSSNQYPGAIYPDGYQFIKRFEHGTNYVRWSYQNSGLKVDKTLVVSKDQNKVSLWFENRGNKLISLSLNPLVCHRDFHANFHERSSYPESIEFDLTETIIEEAGVKLVLSHPGGTRFPVHGWYFRFEHQREIDRGLDPREDLYCPCEIRFDLRPGEKASLVAYVLDSENNHGSLAVPDEPGSVLEPSHGLSELLNIACEKFIVNTDNRSSILAGFPWFSDWGRDTMIALPGICLHAPESRRSERIGLARSILRDYASQMFQGLIPNRFVEKGEKADYNTVDATLWFANAIYKTLVAEWDEAFATEMLKVLDASINWHLKGTLFGIRVDANDGLLCQGTPETQLTWMDAKIGDWVVTPRHGKPVEISALWINMLRVAEWIADQLGEPTATYSKWAILGEANFDAKFWHAGRGHYLDTADPNDASLRPNQVIAISLPFSPCLPENSVKALEVVERELVTPFGLRTLGPKEPGYRGRFRGPITELDAAYHQGTVWPWLLGPYISAYMKNGGTRREAKQKLSMVKHMLMDVGLYGVSECYDGNEPHEPAACPWQAWSAAECLRVWREELDGE